MVGGVADAKHPLIAAHGAHAAADLIGERLKSQLVIRRGQRAGDRIARPLRLLHAEKAVNRFLEPALQQMLVAGERDEAFAIQTELRRQVKSVDRIQEEQRPDPFVQAVGLPTKRIERRTLRQKLLERGVAHRDIEGLVADAGVFGGDDGDELAHARFCLANNSSSWVRTSSRSLPLSASAIWAVSRP